ncbi:MAG TPA: hypothetical protein VMU69_26615 [Bradyrhizobium sp.]|nr:hypothetical protein [Bradyrhizobium sp.]
MQTLQADYFAAYRNLKLSRDDIDLPKGERGDILSGTVDVLSISFRETIAGEPSSGTMRRPASLSSR